MKAEALRNLRILADMTAGQREIEVVIDVLAEELRAAVRQQEMRAPRMVGVHREVVEVIPAVLDGGIDRIMDVPASAGATVLATDPTAPNDCYVRAESLRSFAHHQNIGGAICRIAKSRVKFGRDTIRELDISLEHPIRGVGPIARRPTHAVRVVCSLIRKRLRVGGPQVGTRNPVIVRGIIENIVDAFGPVAAAASLILGILSRWTVQKRDLDVADAKVDRCRVRLIEVVHVVKRRLVNLGKNVNQPGRSLDIIAGGAVLV